MTVPPEQSTVIPSLIASRMVSAGAQAPPSGNGVFGKVGAASSPPPPARPTNAPRDRLWDVLMSQPFERRSAGLGTALSPEAASLDTRYPFGPWRAVNRSHQVRRVPVDRQPRGRRSLQLRRRLADDAA